MFTILVLSPEKSFRILLSLSFSVIFQGYLRPNFNLFSFCICWVKITTWILEWCVQSYKKLFIFWSYFELFVGLLLIYFSNYCVGRHLFFHATNKPVLDPFIFPFHFSISFFQVAIFLVLFSGLRMPCKVIINDLCIGMHLKNEYKQGNLLTLCLIIHSCYSFIHLLVFVLFFDLQAQNKFLNGLV